MIRLPSYDQVPTRASLAGGLPTPSPGSNLGRLKSGVHATTASPRLTPRSSSLNLHQSNSSNVSLASSNKPLASTSTYSGGHHRKAITGPRPPDVKDPLEILDTLFKTTAVLSEDYLQNITEESKLNTYEFLSEDDIDFAGLSLDEFLRHETSNIDGTTLVGSSASSMLTITEADENEKFADLNKSIQACDEVLQSVESYLTSFKVDLGHVSAEIETLQKRSIAINTKLENRKSVEKVLGSVIEDISLPPVVIKRIADHDVNDEWVRTLQEVDKTIKAIEARKAQKIKAADDVAPEITRITNKALERVRDYFVALIKSMRVPNLDVQTLQKGAFMRYKDLFLFMSKHHPTLADEIAQAYVNSMRWYYLHHFSRYQKSLERLKLTLLDKNDLIGIEDSAKRGNLIATLKAGSAGPANYDPFSLGRRIETYKYQDAPLIVDYMIDEDKTAHYPEYPFRCFNVALVDNACSEFFFLSDFFSYKKYDQITQLFNQIFDSTLALGRQFTKTLIDVTLDSIAILLSIRLNQQLAFILQRRRVPVLDGYSNAINMLLWPRLQVVMDAHSESLKKSTAVTGRSALSITGTTTSTQSAAPHPITQRFAQFMSSLLTLSADAADNEPLFNSLGRLRSDFEAFLTKLSSNITDSQKRERFLFNNYSLVLTIISDTEGKLASDQRLHFSTLTRALSSRDNWC